MREVFLSGFSYLWGNVNFNNNEKTYPVSPMNREEEVMCTLGQQAWRCKHYTLLEGVKIGANSVEGDPAASIKQQMMHDLTHL